MTKSKPKSRDRKIAIVAGITDPNTLKQIKVAMQDHAPKRRIDLIPEDEFEQVVRTAQHEVETEKLAGIGDRIREAREALGWQQQELGTRLGLLPSAVAHWEAGRRIPDASSIVKLCRSLGVEADWLLGLDATSEPTKVKRLERFLQRVRDAVEEAGDK